MYIPSGLQPVYRFQGGGKSKNVIIPGQSNNRYGYFSKNLQHHYYYVMKRIKDYYNDLFTKYGIEYNNRNIINLSTFSKMVEVLEGVNYSEDMEILRFYITSEFLELLESNSIYNELKQSGKNYVERIDRRVYGGGYGISPEWMELFNDFSLLLSKITITREDLILILKKIRILLCSYRKEYPRHLIIGDTLSQKIPIQYINKNAFGDTRKVIKRHFELIIDKGLFLPKGEFSYDSKGVISRNIITYNNIKTKFFDDRDDISIYPSVDNYRGFKLL